MAPQHRPLNPEDEDGLVPNEHAAYSINKATQSNREPAWRDLALTSILTAGPPVQNTQSTSSSIGQQLGQQLGQQRG